MLGWSPYEYYTSSPCEFYYACKGYLNKEGKRSELIRLQTFFILINNGAKVQNPQQLWKIESIDDDEMIGDIPAWAATSLELRKEIIKKLKLGNAAT